MRPEEPLARIFPKSAAARLVLLPFLATAGAGYLVLRNLPQCPLQGALGEEISKAEAVIGRLFCMCKHIGSARARYEMIPQMQEASLDDKPERRRHDEACGNIDHEAGQALKIFPAKDHPVELVDGLMGQIQAVR